MSHYVTIILQRLSFCNKKSCIRNTFLRLIRFYIMSLFRILRLFPKRTAASYEAAVFVCIRRVFKAKTNINAITRFCNYYGIRTFSVYISTGSILKPKLNFLSSSRRLFSGVFSSRFSLIALKRQSRLSIVLCSGTRSKS